MSVWAVSMVKDEADVIEQTLLHLHGEGIAGAVVLDNGSTDGTRAILDMLAAAPLAGWLRVIDDPEVGYWQSSKMTSAAKMAGQLGATWVLPFDADEIWTSTTERNLADTILLGGDGVSGQPATLFDHYCTAIDDGEPGAEFDDPFTRMGWRSQHALSLPKVCVRAEDLHSIHPGNHGATFRHGGFASDDGRLRVHHFPYRSPRQMVSKVRNGSNAYKATTLPYTTGQHWREMGAVLDAAGEAGITQWWRDAFFYERPAERGLIFDPVELSGRA